MNETKLSFAGKQINGTSFRLDDKYYKGRIEEARIIYHQFPEINRQYTFNQYVNLSYSQIKKPKLEIKQELIDICSKYMEAKEMVNVLFLIEKL
jgi:hypothetical protein